MALTEPPKPRHSSGYSPDELEQVRSALLTVAVTLGSFLNDLCVIGGVVPSVLIDRTGGYDEPVHVGTNDLDVALDVGLLDGGRYAELSDRLRAEGFHADESAAGNPVFQRWRLDHLNVTIDFLIEPAGERPGTIKKLEADFGALVARGVNLAFEDREMIAVRGHTLAGEQLVRTVPICGPAAFVVLKAFALAGRGEPKDAYDLVYVLRHFPGGVTTVAKRLVALRDQVRVSEAVDELAVYFAEVDSVGSRRAAEFVLAAGAERDEIDERAADDRGVVLDLVDLWRASR